jgi:DnaK suppressor protein
MELSSAQDSEGAGFIMKEYDEVRGKLIEMLEDIDDRLAKITNDVKHSEEHLEEDLAEQIGETNNIPRS